jgi:B12-binding domain/radical SAM domain protein
VDGGLTVVLRYRRTNTYGQHVCLAALEVEPPSAPVTVELGHTVAETIERITAARARGDRVLVAWSYYSPDFLAAVEELAQVRAATGAADREAVLHLAGGVHATAEPLVTLRHGFDAVAIGEGEHTFAAFIEALVTGADWRTVPGTAHLDEHGALVKARPAVTYDLDHYPAFPHRRNLTNPIEITRGCVYACQFCQTPFMFKARFRHRSVASVREHVRIMRARGKRDVRFITPTSLSYGSPDTSVNLDAIEELLAGVRAELPPGGRIFFGSFPSEVRPEHVTVEALRLLKRYVANDNLIIGGQSGSETVLARSHRGHGVEEVERAVRLARQEGFLPHVDVIVGMPGETPEDEQATIRLAERLADLGARIHAHTFMPLPGTPWRDESPGQVSASTRAALDRLVSAGQGYGPWQRQAEIARQLATVRSAEQGYRIRRTRSRTTANADDPRPAQ